MLTYRRPHHRRLTRYAHPTTITLPVNLLASAGTVVDDFETTVGWTPNNGALANDAVYYKTGAQSVEFTCVEGGLGRATKTVSITIPNSREIRLWAYVPDAAKIVSLTTTIMLSGSADMTKRFHAYITVRTGWNLLTFKPADWTVLGAMTWADQIIFFRLQFTGAEGEVTTISFDSLTANVVAAKPALLLTFDDADETVYTEAFTHMATRNIPGTFYVWTEQVDGEDKVTTAQLLEMQAAGWTIANHTQTHADLTALNQAQIQAELAAATADLQGWGITGDAPLHAAYPGGLYNDTVLAAMAAESMLTGRTIAAVKYPALPLDQPYAVPIGKSFGNTLTLTAAKAWVASLVSRNDLGIAVFHTLVASPSTSTQWGIADFHALCQYLAAMRIPCLTIDQAYRLQSAPVACALPT